jgi:hypothetical protein
MMDVCRRFPGAEFWTNIFTPYPGTPVMEQASEIGIEVPTTLEGWADFFPRYTLLPWLKGKDHERLQVTREYLRLAFERIPIADDRRDKMRRLFQKLISIPARWRLDHDVYKFPVEIWLLNSMRRLASIAKKLSVNRKSLYPTDQGGR